MRAISDTLLAAQQSPSRTPYIRIRINDVDYSNRLLLLEHHEDPYRDWAIIELDNSDRGLDSVSTTTNNLLGRAFVVGYGYKTVVGNEYSDSATLWVKSQQMISSPGRLVCILGCEGQWNYLREQRLMVSGGEAAKGDPDSVGDDPYYSDTFEGTKTVYQLVETVLEQAIGWTLNATPSPDDGILNTFKPVYSLEELPNAASVLRDLIMMTKCYLRAKANCAWDIVYPQTSDTVNEVYYSDQPPYFLEYAEKLSLNIPNRIAVFANGPGDGPSYPAPWPDLIVGITDAYSGNYVEVLDFELAPTITEPEDVSKRASALLTRVQAEEFASYLIVPHDCRVEPYDKIEINDRRGT